MEAGHRRAHLRLWLDLTRLAPPGLAAAPASLLAVTAWQSGNGALASVALDRALADDRDYAMARRLRRIPYCAAVHRSWDLALFGAHGSEIFFTAGARVHVQHGLGAGKLVNGQDYTYGPKWALWEGTPKYDRMLEASHAVRRYAVAACPPLAGISAWWATCEPTGCWPLTGTGPRTGAALGIRPGELAVLVISTFGPDGLLGRHGLGPVDELLAASGIRVLRPVPGSQPPGAA